MNGISTQTNGGAGNDFSNKRGRKKTNKFDSIIYHCFICNSIKHQIYEYPHKDIAQTKFKEKATTTAPKKENIVINMVLGIITYIQILENVVFKDKNLSRTRDWLMGKKKKCFNICLKKLLKYTIKGAAKRSAWS